MEVPSVFSLQRNAILCIVKHFLLGVENVRSVVIEIVDTYNENHWLNCHNGWNTLMDNIYTTTSESLTEMPEVPHCLKADILQELYAQLVECLYWTQFFVHHLQKRVRNWHSRYTSEILSSLQWNGMGKVDRRKTTKKLIGLKVLDPLSRFELAVFNLMVEEANIVWMQELNPGAVVPVYGNVDPDADENRERDKMKLWLMTHFRKCTRNKCNQFWKSSLYWCFKMGSDVGAFTCWNNLDSEARHALLTSPNLRLIQQLFPVEAIAAKDTHIPIYEIFPPRYFTWHRGFNDLALYIFKHMTEEELKIVLSNPHCIMYDIPTMLLQIFLKYPLQSKFMINLKLFTQRGLELDYNLLTTWVVRRFAFRTTSEDKSFDYRELFIELWNYSPESFKQELADNNDDWFCSLFLDASFQRDNGMCMQVLLKSMTPLQRQRFCERYGKKLSIELFRTNWKAFDIFAKECSPYYID